jgi:hypothetical protein
MRSDSMRSASSCQRRIAVQVGSDCTERAPSSDFKSWLLGGALVFLVLGFFQTVPTQSLQEAQPFQRRLVLGCCCCCSSHYSFSPNNSEFARRGELNDQAKDHHSVARRSGICCLLVLLGLATHAGQPPLTSLNSSNFDLFKDAFNDGGSRCTPPLAHLNVRPKT